MKLKSAVLAVSLLAFGAGAAHAGSWSLGLNGGAGMPTGNFGDFASTGWNVGVNATNMVNNNWGFGADLGYHAWGAKEEVLSPGEDLNFSAIQATARGIYQFQTNSNMQPFMQMGLGMYNLGQKSEGGPSGDYDNSSSELGFNFGAGMNFATQGDMRWGISGLYHSIQTEGESTNMFTLGLNVNFGMGN